MRHDRLLLLAGAVAGLVLAALVTLVQDETFRADASIAIVRQGQPPGSDPALAEAAAAAVDLLHSRAVAESAIANLQLDESAEGLLDRVELSAESASSLIRIEVEAPSRDEARRTAQEVAEVATVLFNDRFGPTTVASIWEAPRADEDPVAPRPARNLSFGALAGALAGIAFAALRRRPRRQERPVVASPAARAPSPQPAPTTPEPTSTAFARPEHGEWTVADVERLLAEQGGAYPARQEELGVYLTAFRDVAGPDGRLPGGVQTIVEDVFADLIARARRD